MSCTRINPTTLSQLKVVTVTATLPAGEYAVYITAPSVSGYSFVCWLGGATTGWVGDVYIGEMDASTTRLWSTRVIGGSNPATYTSAAGAKAFALYAKS